MCFLSSASELVGYLCCYINDRFSRKKVLIAFLASASIMCLTVVLIPLNNNNNNNNNEAAQQQQQQQQQPSNDLILNGAGDDDDYRPLSSLKQVYTYTFLLLFLK